MFRVEVVDCGLVVCRTALDLEITVTLHAAFVGGLAQVLRSDMLGVARRAGWCEGLQRLVDRSLMTAQASLIADMFAEANIDEACLQRRCMARVAAFSGERVHRRKRTTGVRLRIPPDRIASEPEDRDRRNCRHQNSPKQPPFPPALEVVEVVSLSETLGCAFAGHVCVSRLERLQHESLP